MVEGVKARYSQGAIMPLEPLDIEEGASLRISIEVESRTARGERGLKALRASAGGWKGTHDPDELIRDIYEARLTGSRHLQRLQGLTVMSVEDEYHAN